jgi:hypothetical protein
LAPAVAISLLAIAACGGSEEPLITPTLSDFKAFRQCVAEDVKVGRSGSTFGDAADSFSTSSFARTTDAKTHERVLIEAIGDVSIYNDPEAAIRGAILAEESHFVAERESNVVWVSSFPLPQRTVAVIRSCVADPG